MGLFGPFTAVANQVQQCALSPDAEAIYVLNTSRYDLGIAFQSFQPAPTTAFGGDPWFATVPTGDRRGIRIPKGIYGANGFPGYVYVLPIDNTVKLAQGGTVSANVIFSVESYPDARYLPPDYASPQRQDASSQQRVIALPYGAVSRANGQVNVTATGLQPPTFILAGAPGVALNPNAPGSPGAFTWSTYLHYLDVYTDGQTYNFHLTVISFDTSGGAQFSAQIYLGRATPTAPVQKTFTITPSIQESLVSNTATVQVQLFIDFASALTGSLILQSGWTCDFLSGVVVPAIGQGSSIGFQSTGGAVF